MKTLTGGYQIARLVPLLLMRVLLLFIFTMKMVLKKFSCVHTSPVHFSAIDELLRDTRAAIRSSANIDASLYFGMMANDDLSAKVAIELKEKSKKDDSSIFILQTNLKGEQYESYSTVLCEYEVRTR
jgi:hypothetical protein